MKEPLKTGLILAFWCGVAFFVYDKFLAPSQDSGTSNEPAGEPATLDAQG